MRWREVRDWGVAWGAWSSAAVAEKAPSPASSRLLYVDALRGFACVWVLLHHSFEHIAPTGAWLSDSFLAFCRIGWLGVSLFLVLSGFCLSYPILRRHPVEEARLSIADFARKRAWRILPPYYAAVALFTFVAWHAQRNSIPWPETVGWKDVLTHALLLHNLRPSTIASINPAMWSLALEVQLYVLFPLLLWLGRRGGLRMILAATLGLSVTWQLGCFLRYGLSLEWDATLATAYHSLPARCFEFALGMAAARLVATRSTRHLALARLAIAVLLLPLLWFVLRVSRFAPLCDQLLGIVFASVLVLGSTVPAQWATRWPLRWLTVVGLASYSIYLIHQPLIMAFPPERFGIAANTPGAVLLFGFARLAVVMALGIAFYIAIERPFTIARPRTRPARGNLQPLPVSG